ncbi:hypothetical protein BG011_006547 [Mortierella polycephala]|uniref:Smr domain-containing protein n=1 Tax=Mortierella polycephala TaxID=41804 RepID=A0A9P6PVS4_9FUNG|nr:hypothetical protein BG011_006547 [Mortierella polycephala]
MFCPRLDSALVVSIYHDIGDFKACIPILSTLAAAAPPTSSSSSSSPSPTTAQPVLSFANASAIRNTQKRAPANTNINSSKNNKASVSNDKNILNWSEEVANSNATTTNGSRSNGRIKQGQITNSSAQYQYHGSTTSLTAPLATGTTMTSATNPTFKAVRNPLYMKNHAVAEQAPASVKEFEDEFHGVQDDEQDEAVDEFPALQQQQASPPPHNQQQEQKKGKKNRKKKKSATTDPSVSATPCTTWEKDEAQLEGQLTGLIISDGQSQGSQEYEMIAHEGQQQQHTTTNGRSDGRNGRDAIKTEELEFLKSCFPDREHSDEYLAQVLRDCKRDLEAAVETILSQMFLDNEQVETSSSGSGSLYSSGSLTACSSSTGASSLDDSFFQGMAKTKKKRKSKAGGGEWGTRPPATCNGQSDALLRTMECQDMFLIPESNEWATFEHQISILMNIFHTVPQKTIVSEFHANGTNLFRAVDSLEKRLRTENHHGSAGGRDRHSHFDVALAQLMEMFPEHNAVGLKKMLVYNGGDLQDAMNAVLAADISRAEQNEDRHLLSSTSSSSSKRATMVPFQADIRFADKNAAPTPSNSGNRLRSLPSTNNPFPGGSRSFPNTILDNANTELYNDEDDAVWCRQQAQGVLEQRNELFRKAAQAYKQTKGKGAGMSGIAAYYADEGKKLDAQGKQWHMRAARAIVQKHRLESNDPNLVDLHGLTVVEAQTVVKEAVTQWYSRATMQASRVTAKPLRIVCGVGSHSRNKIARLYPTILSLLMKDGWQCVAENGVITVKGVSRIMPSSSKKK